MNATEVSALLQSINYHGQSLQKLCENSPKLQEPLAKVNSEINFKEYESRQKYLSFQDRGKRLRLQEFIAKHGSTLFDYNFITTPVDNWLKTVDESYFAALPPFEAFLHGDKEAKIRRFYETIKEGDTLICKVTTKQSVYGVTVLIAEGEKPYVVADLGIKAVIQLHHVMGSRLVVVGDLVRSTVLEVVAEADKLVIGDAKPLTEPLPAIFKKASVDARNDSYDGLLHSNPGFSNPSSSNYLAGVLAVGSEHHSHMLSLKGSFPSDETAPELRQQQAAKWAFKSVAEGIEHFKAGRHSEAFQSLNTALSIDPRNLEGLVARGALYANSANFTKAIQDFEMALKINPNHPNTRKYMGETLIALGRCHEDKNEIEDAVRAYEQCLQLLPYHEDALNSIEYLRSKNLIPPKENTDEKKKKAKKDKKKRKRQASSSGSSSSSSSSGSGSSSDSSSDSSSNSDSSDSSGHARKKKKKNKKEKKDKSLSPISKRMLLDPTVDLEGLQRNQCNPASFAGKSGGPEKDRDYEMRVRSFLEQTKGDSDYEDKVRKFLAEASSYNKFERKSTDEKEKKKKKKDKKDRKEKSKKKKDKEEKRNKRKRQKKDKKYGEGDVDDDEEEERLRDALRKEMSMKQELRRRVAAHDALEATLYMKKEASKKFEDDIPIPEPPPKSYRTEFEQSRGKKAVDIFKESPPKPANKIQIGPITAASRFLQKKDSEDKPWESSSTGRIGSISSISMPPMKPRSPPPQPPEPIKTGVDKFSFRVKILDPPEPKPERDRRSRSSGSSGHSSRSGRSRSYGSRSRSRSGDSGSRSRSRSRSRSYSHSRSRSRSPRRYQRYRGNSRGTYYKPRFHNNMQYRPRGGRYDMRGGRGNYYNNRYDNRFDPRRGGRGGYIPRFNNMRGPRRGGFYPRGNPYYDNRRHYHDDGRRDRDRDRDRDRSHSLSDEETMRRVGAAKERIDRRIGEEERRRGGDSPLSEGEAPDSPAVAAAPPTNGDPRVAPATTT